MENIEVFIERYDSDNHSLVAHFKSVIDGIEHTTPSFNFQPFQLNVSSTQELLEKMAELGVISIENEIAKKQFIDSTNFLDEMSKLEGKSFIFNANEVRTTPPAAASLVLDNLEIEL
jgi:hypothetical protein